MAGMAADRRRRPDTRSTPRIGGLDLHELLDPPDLVTGSDRTYPASGEARRADVVGPAPPADRGGQRGAPGGRDRPGRGRRRLGGAGLRQAASHPRGPGADLRGDHRVGHRAGELAPRDGADGPLQDGPVAQHRGHPPLRGWDLHLAGPRLRTGPDERVDRAGRLRPPVGLRARPRGHRRDRPGGGRAAPSERRGPPGRALRRRPGHVGGLAAPASGRPLARRRRRLPDGGAPPRAQAAAPLRRARPRLTTDRRPPRVPPVRPRPGPPRAAAPRSAGVQRPAADQPGPPAARPRPDSTAPPCSTPSGAPWWASGCAWSPVVEAEEAVAAGRRHPAHQRPTVQLRRAGRSLVIAVSEDGPVTVFRRGEVLGRSGLTAAPEA